MNFAFDCGANVSFDCKVWIVCCSCSLVSVFSGLRRGERFCSSSARVVFSLKSWVFIPKVRPMARIASRAAVFFGSIVCRIFAIWFWPQILGRKFVFVLSVIGERIAFLPMKNGVFVLDLCGISFGRISRSFGFFVTFSCEIFVCQFCHFSQISDFSTSCHGLRKSFWYHPPVFCASIFSVGFGVGFRSRIIFGVCVWLIISNGICVLESVIMMVVWFSSCGVGAAF